MAYPLKYRTKENDIKKDLSYYESRVGDGPAMTHAIFSLLYARMGDSEKALDRFFEGYRGNLLPPFGVIAETKGGTNPYFATGAGGMLQAVINGLGGLDISENGIIQLKTYLPKKWKSLKIKGVGLEKTTYEVTH
ncbi:hypothetical protein [Rhizosphaericola mali]|uniref:hypothetical protein n=1 Tax=Rhizosphaericola mali TaxID=2545455 RepID=UPI0021066771|nr:hypothetical protein [Rhizosphaericola mali]